jgi:uncharacterized membrane protein YdjX (TVP38/TMEM64 family)
MSGRPESAAVRAAPSPVLRFGLLFLAVAIVFALPFVAWGDKFEAFLHQDRLVAWFESYRGFAWLIAIGLLVSDLVLPIPNTVVIAALGILYGAVLGGLVATVGTCLSGILAFGLCRHFGRPLAARLVDAAELKAGELLFARSGGLIVAASRWLPVLAEAVACMAGLSRMPPTAFVVALVCGAAPLCFTVAALGDFGADRPLLVLALCGLLPIPIWLLVRNVLAAGRSA